MPRGGSGRSSGGKSSFRAGPTRTATTTQAPLRSAPTSAPTQSTGGFLSGFGGMIAQGMAFGAGSEIAHQAVRGIMGGNSHAQPQQVIEQQPIQQYSQQGQEMCKFESGQFMNCLKNNDNSINFCQSYFDVLKQCQGK